MTLEDISKYEFFSQRRVMELLVVEVLAAAVATPAASAAVSHAAVITFYTSLKRRL